MLTNSMEFFPQNVLVNTKEPPEEIAASIVGGFGPWQICVLTVGLLSVWLSTLDVLTVRTSVPGTVNFTCKNGNGSQCYTINGTKCEDFEYFENYRYLVLSWFRCKLNLVCDKKELTVWTKYCHRMGMTIGYVIVGRCVDLYGIKIISMVFISLGCITGFLTISMESHLILICFVSLHGLFTTCMRLLPLVAVCDIIGNKWRTLALGITILPRAFTIVIFTPFFAVFQKVGAVIVTISVLPLIFLIPLLFYKDSPNYICIMHDFSRAETILRKIANFNRWPMSPNVKVRPVQLLVDSNKPATSTLRELWAPWCIIRAFLAFIVLWFYAGFCSSALMHYIYAQFEILSLFGLCATIGILLSIGFCYWIPHRVVIGIFAFLRSANIFGILLYSEIDWKHSEVISLSAIQIVCGLLVWTSTAALFNITPRMFPTEARALCLGFCFSVYEIGYLTELLIHSYVHKTLVVSGTFLILGFILETLACLQLWDVHKRELPDFLIDCVKFNTFYKPTRYYTIYDTASQDEIEVKSVDMTNLREQRLKEAV